MGRKKTTNHTWGAYGPPDEKALAAMPADERLLLRRYVDALIILRATSGTSDPLHMLHSHAAKDHIAWQQVGTHTEIGEYLKEYVKAHPESVIYTKAPEELVVQPMLDALRAEVTQIMADLERRQPARVESPPLKELLVDARTNAHLSIAELAVKAGLDAEDIKQYENGVLPPTISPLKKIFAACGTLESSMKSQSVRELKSSLGYTYSMLDQLTIPQLIINARIDAGRTQKELADHLNTDEHNIAEYEAGERQPRTKAWLIQLFNACRKPHYAHASAVVESNLLSNIDRNELPGTAEKPGISASR